MVIFENGINLCQNYQTIITDFRHHQYIAGSLKGIGFGSLLKIDSFLSWNYRECLQRNLYLFGACVEYFIERIHLSF